MTRRPRPFPTSTVAVLIAGVVAGLIGRIVSPAAPHTTAAYWLAPVLALLSIVLVTIGVALAVVAIVRGGIAEMKEGR